MRLHHILKTILFGVPVGVTIIDTVGYVARVDGVSMQPVLNPDSCKKDYVFLNKWSVRCYRICRGEIISLTSPKDPTQLMIKRLVGIEGDVIQTLGYEKEFVKVPEGHCWVEGDHTGHTFDSNSFGPVALALVTAKAYCIVWPPSRWQKLKVELPTSRIPINLRENELNSLVIS